MLVQDKKAEIARLRAAWSKHTQESIRAVEERCSRELTEAVSALKAQLSAVSVDCADASVQVTAPCDDAVGGVRPAAVIVACLDKLRSCRRQ